MTRLLRLSSLNCLVKPQILECIQKGTCNPGGIAKKLNRYRSTVEKHLRVLLKANIVGKVPSLTTQVNFLFVTRYVTTPKD